MKRIIFLSILLSLLFSSCGAYFNTFYNTKKLFNEARKEREKRTRDTPSASEIRKYDQTIEKASKVLELYPTSKYVDDAVMILGECFYYKGQYVRAQRKYQELIKYFPKSSHFQSAKIWLAKTNVKLGDHVAAKVILTELLNSEKTKREIRDESLYLLGDLLFQQEKYGEAEEALKRAAESVKDKRIRAHAYSRLGECQIINGKPGEAVESFSNALRDSPSLDFEFDAHLNHARALKLADQFDAAVAACGELLDNQLHKRKHGFVRLEIADCVYQEGKYLLKDDATREAGMSKIQDALTEYATIALENKRTEVSAIANYRMARIYEEQFSDYASAREHYEKVRQEYARSDLVPEATRKAKDIGDLIRLTNLVKKAQGEQLLQEGKHSKFLTELEKLLLEYGVHPELRFMRKQKELAASKPKSESELAKQEETKQKERDKLVANKLQLAEIYLFQFSEVDSALNEYNEIITLFPDHPGSARALFSSAFIYENEHHNKFKTDSLLQELVLKFPDSIQAQEARRKLGRPAPKSPEEAVKQLFQEAETELFVRERTPRAVRLYQRIVAEYPETEYAQKALFVLGWVEENIHFNNDKAFVIYKRIADDYPDSIFTAGINKKLRAVEREKQAAKKAEAAEKAAAQDSTSEGQSPPKSGTPALQEKDVVKKPSLDEKPVKDDARLLKPKAAVIDSVPPKKVP